MSTHDYSGRSRLTPRVPYDPDVAEAIIQDVLSGHPLTHATVRNGIPYSRFTYWLRRGRQADGPEEWRRLATRLAWADARLAINRYTEALRKLFPDEEPEFGQERLLFE